MDVVVRPDPNIPTRGTLLCGLREFPCVLGRGGVSADKQEGDGATPIGTFPLRQVFYRPDRTQTPRTGLPTVAIVPDDGWCDAPESALYNQLVKLPLDTSAENMWRDDHVYDVVVVIGYNDAPVLPGKGSAIFMHLTRPDAAPTAGCVALSKGDLLAVLAELDSASRITIQV